MDFFDKRILQGTLEYGAKGIANLSPVLCEHDLEVAWSEWVFRDCLTDQIDEWVLPLLPLTTQRPWIKPAREASGVSTREMAKRLGVRQFAYEKFERAEDEKRITLLSLERCAEALNCELVYGLRPKEGKTFSRRRWEARLMEAQGHPFLPKAVVQQRGYFLANLIRAKEGRPIC